jgi:hypothetical protein
MKASLVGLSALALSCAFSFPANAVPGSGVRATEIDSGVVQVGCHWRHGHRYCEPAVVIDLGRRHRHWNRHSRDHDHDRDQHGHGHDHDHDHDKR